MNFSEAKLQKALSLVHQHHYIELVLQRQFPAALQVLQNELATDPAKHFLASLLLCRTIEDVR